MENSLQEYNVFIKEIKNLIYSRQYEAMKQVNNGRRFCFPWQPISFRGRRRRLLY